MKMILTSAATPDEYVACLGGWQRAYAQALREVVANAAPELEERLKWGHLVYVRDGPVLLIRAEPQRVLFGFWRGQRLRHIEPRLKPGGKYQMATLEQIDVTKRLIARYPAELQYATDAAGVTYSLYDTAAADPSGDRRRHHHGRCGPSVGL